MPPKKNIEDLVVALSEKLDGISAQLTNLSNRMDGQDARFDRLEKMLDTANKTNAALTETSRVHSAEIDALKEHVNNLEQRGRAACIRVFKFPITGDPSNNANVTTQLYNNLLLPILRGAVTKGTIDAVPSCDALIETCHILPGNGDQKPIICRFTKLFYKTTVMRLKKEFAPKAAGDRPDRPGYQLYSVFEDVTRDTYALMKKLGSDRRVDSSWFSAGALPACPLLLFF